jgi:LacI family transcriptional regulator
MAMATIRDVARESGFSVATVSYVLNNGPRTVRPRTRERVLAVMRELDYHPNAMARGLVSRRLHTVGVLFGQIETTVVTNPYAASLLPGILSAAAACGYNVTLFPEQWEGESQSASSLRDRRTDGLLLVSPLTDSDMLNAVAMLDIPAIAISSARDGYGIPTVDVDNRLGGRLAAEHLMALGHQRIAHIHGKENHSSVPERREGFLGALKERGIYIAPEYLVAADYSGRATTEQIVELLQLPTPPTAIFAGNDIIAIKILEIARELNISVPEQLSVIGFDDIPSATLVSPSLTTVRQPLFDIGQCATRQLIGRIEHRPRDAEKGEGFVDTPVRRIEPTLIVRATTGPPPALGGACEQPCM